MKAILLAIGFVLALTAIICLALLWAIYDVKQDRKKKENERKMQEKGVFRADNYDCRE